MRAIAIIQARVGSSRLPSKALRLIAGRPMIAHVFERVAAVRGLDAVVLATSNNARDDELASLVSVLGYPVVRGNGQENDVLGRYVQAAREYEADVVVRVTGDCPCWAPEVGQRVLATYRAEPYWDYVSNDVTVSGYPDGMDCEIVTAAALQQADAHATDHVDREHVTPWIRRTLACRTVMSLENWHHLKLSVDTLDDLRHVCSLYTYLRPGEWSLSATLAAEQRVRGSRLGPPVPSLTTFSPEELRTWLTQK